MPNRQLKPGDAIEFQTERMPETRIGIVQAVEADRFQMEPLPIKDAVGQWYFKPLTWWRHVDETNEETRPMSEEPGRYKTDAKPCVDCGAPSYGPKAKRCEGCHKAKIREWKAESRARGKNEKATTADRPVERTITAPPTAPATRPHDESPDVYQMIAMAADAARKHEEKAKAIHECVLAVRAGRIAERQLFAILAEG